MGFEVVGLEVAEVDQSSAAGGLDQTAAELLGTAALGRTAAAVAVLLLAGTQRSAQRRTETVAAADQIVAVAGQIGSFGIEEESAVAAVVWAAAKDFAELEAAARDSAEAVAKGSASVERGSS